MLSTAKNKQKMFSASQNPWINYATCKDRLRAYDGLKCISFKRKYTIVFYQFEEEVIVTAFIPSKLIRQ